MLHEEFYDATYADLLLVAEGSEPFSELVGALDFPGRAGLCHRYHHSFKVILGGARSRLHRYGYSADRHRKINAG